MHFVYNWVQVYTNSINGDGVNFYLFMLYKKHNIEETPCTKIQNYKANLALHLIIISVCITYPRSGQKSHKNTEEKAQVHN